MAVTPVLTSPIVLETVDNCPLCGERALVFVFECEDRLHGVPGRFGLCRCERCGAGVLSPRPTREDLPHYYPETYGAYNLRRWAADSRRPRFFKRALRRGLRLITVVLPDPSTRLWSKLRDCPQNSHPRVLDVGCGNGRLLEQDVRAGWVGVGIDFSPLAVARARERGLNVMLGVVEEVGLSAESFDLVRLSHVLEHVPDPVSMLRRTFELLRPGGLAHVVTPNFASPTARLMGTYWWGLEAPRHLVLFTPENLRAVAKTVGFEVDREVHEVVPSDFWASIHYWLRARPSTGRLVRGRELKYSANLRHLIYPLWWAAAHLKRGERMHFVLRKPLGS